MLLFTHIKEKTLFQFQHYKASANIGFFKGALMTDPHKILQQQGNIQSARIIRFTQVDEIEQIKATLTTYILEANAIEESGKKVEMKKDLEPLPEELLHAFEVDSVFKNAFYALTPGRQRAYIITFSQPKQTQTRISRIEKYKEQIFKGIGLHDKYSC